MNDPSWELGPVNGGLSDADIAELFRRGILAPAGGLRHVGPLPPLPDDYHEWTFDSV